jgi:hypothetical protein
MYQITFTTPGFEDIPSYFTGWDIYKPKKRNARWNYLSSSGLVFHSMTEARSTIRDLLYDKYDPLFIAIVSVKQENANYLHS